MDLQGSLVEDYAFALECMRRGYGVGEINGIVREQSPRASWTSCARGEGGWWASGAVRPVALGTSMGSAVVSQPAGEDGHGRRCGIGAQSVSAASRGGSLFASTFLYLYLVGSVLQDLDCGTRPRTLVKRAFATALFFPVSYALESVAVLWAFVSRNVASAFRPSGNRTCRQLVRATTACLRRCAAGPTAFGHHNVGRRFSTTTRTGRSMMAILCLFRIRICGG